MAAPLLRAEVGAVTWLDVVKFCEAVATLSGEVSKFSLAGTVSFLFDILGSGVLVLPPFGRLEEALAGTLEGDWERAFSAFFGLALVALPGLFF